MASIASNDVLILSHRANPLRWDFRERQVKNEWKARGRRTLEIDPVELTKAANAYLNENRARLREEARAILTKV
jgi:hypothetical protein